MKTFGIFRHLFLAALLGVAIVFSGKILYERRREILNFFQPCTSPITYRVGSQDKRFDISREAFLEAIGDAERIWESPVGKDLFTYDASGALVINLIYDYRQEATETLKPLGLTLENSETSYNALKAQYDSLHPRYEEQESELDLLVTQYNQKKNTYDANIAYWNSHGGAPKKEFEELNRERENLSALAKNIREEEAALNNLVDTINALADTMNRLGKELHLNVQLYNTIGEERGREFEEGTYIGGPGGGEIRIYEFDSRERLVRVLAHEFGHALGLPHVDDPRAILYRLNNGTNEKLSVADIHVLKQKCRIAE